MDIEDYLLVQLVAPELLAPSFENIDPNDPFYKLTDEEFVEFFRITKSRMKQLIEVLQPHMHVGRGKSATSVETKILMAVLFYAHGSYQKPLCKSLSFNVSQSTASRAIHEVTEAFDRIKGNYIRFPQSFSEFERIQLRFQQKYNLPGIVGVVDGIHVPIVRPIENAHIYLNRKRFHSINIQLICDENLKIMSADCRFPGSTNDSFVWRESSINQYMENAYKANNGTYYLLGDSGYALRPWMITPFRNAIDGTPEHRFNEAHARIRNVVERCNDVLKNRWRCLHKDKALHYSPLMACKIIEACCVLHNISLAEPQLTEEDGGNKVDVDEEVELDEDVEIEEDVATEVHCNENGVVGTYLAQGKILRERIVNTYFNSLY